MWIAYLLYTRYSRVVGTLETLGVVDKQRFFVAVCLVVVGDGQSPGVMRLRGRQVSRWHWESARQFLIWHKGPRLREVCVSSVCLQSTHVVLYDPFAIRKQWILGFIASSSDNSVSNQSLTIPPWLSAATYPPQLSIHAGLLLPTNSVSGAKH